MKKIVFLSVVSAFISSIPISINALSFSFCEDSTNLTDKNISSSLLSTARSSQIKMAEHFRPSHTKSLSRLHVFKDEKNIDIYFNYNETYRIEVSNKEYENIFQQFDCNEIYHSTVDISYFPSGKYTIKVVLSTGYYIGTFEISER